MNNSDLAFLWDMDGTIIDTGESHYTSWKIILEKHGVELERHVFFENFGQNNQACTPVYLGYQPTPELLNEISEEKEALFREVALRQATLVRGVRDWLQAINNAGMVQVIASSAPMDNITELINKFNLQLFFNDIVSGYELPAKPAPDVFLQAASILDRSPDSCCVIEDSIVGVGAAKNAGMTCIAVATSQHPSKLSMADIIIDDFSVPIQDVLRSITSPRLKTR